MSLTKKQIAQLKEQGLTLDYEGNIVRVHAEKPSKIVSIVKEGVEDGQDLGKKVVTKTGRGLKRAGTEAVYYGVDVPTEAVKATGSGISTLGHKVAESHRERVQRKAERREAKRAARAAAKAAKAEAEAEALRKAADLKDQVAVEAEAEASTA